MKKVIVIQDFATTASPDLQGALTVAYRRSERLYIANLDYPADRVTIKHDRIKGLMTIEIRLHENEYVAFADGSGLAVKQEIASTGVAL